MAKKKHLVKMKCQETGRVLYWTRKNAKQNPEPLEMKKYNSVLRKRTVFRESKK